MLPRAEATEREICAALARERAGHAAEALETRSAVSAAERQLIVIRRRQAAEKSARAETALASLTVTAPQDGFVLLRRAHQREPLKVGDSVWPGEAIAELP